MPRQPITLAAPVSNGGVRALPGPVKEREDAMLEDADEVLRGVIARAPPLAEIVAVHQRQRALRAGQSEEVDRHPRRPDPVARLFDPLDLARGKGDAGRRDKADDLVAGIVEPTDPRVFREE